MGRPKGSQNRASRELLYKLEKEHNFFVVKKIVALYDEIEEAAKPLVLKALENARNSLSPTHGMSDNEVDMLNNTQKNRWTILGKLLAYCYPKLKALEVDATTDFDKIQFNINIPTGKVEITQDEEPEKKEGEK